MKLFISILSITMLSTLGVIASNYGEEKSTQSRPNDYSKYNSNESENAKIRISAEFTGSPKRNKPVCEKLGTACLGLEITISINAQDSPPRTTNQIIFTNNGNSTLTLELLQTADMDDNLLVVDSNYEFSSRLREALKIKQTHIPKGVYKVNSIKNGVVNVTVPIK